MKDKRKVGEQIIQAVTDDHAESNLSHIQMETLVFMKQQVKRIPLPNNTMVFQAAAFLCCTRLASSSNRILMYFFSVCEYENFISIDIQTLSELLKITTRSIKSGLKELEDNNIIVKTKNIRDKRRHDYFINPVVSWRGNSATWDKKKKQIQAHDPNQLNLFGEENLQNVEKRARKIKADFTKAPDNKFEDFTEVE